MINVAKRCMEVSLLGAIGVHVNVTTAQELEFGIELDLVPIQHQLVMGKAAWVVL